MDSLLRRRQPRTKLEEFVDNPTLWLAQWLYQVSVVTHRSLSAQIRIVCISDTHSRHNDLPALPSGDVLIHAGDLTQSGTATELHSALSWLSLQPHTHKVFIAGNHDSGLSDSDLPSQFPGLVYLCDSSASLEVRGRTVRLYGSPWTPKHGSWPFQYPRREGHERWTSIPVDTDILVTHGPPAHHLDNGSGCAGLLLALRRVRPALHVFGHIHAARGVRILDFSCAQAAYERVADSAHWPGRLYHLMALLWHANLSWVLSVCNRGRGGSLRATVLVNAASLGGYRDELLRGAIVVDI